MLVSNSVINWFNCYYLHLIITVIVIIDLFQSNRRIHDFTLYYVAIITSIYIFYFIFITIRKYGYNIVVYKFMKESSPLFFVILFTFTYLFLLISYFLQILLIKFKCNYFSFRNNKSEKDTNIDDDQNIKLIEEGRF